MVWLYSWVRYAVIGRGILNAASGKNYIIQSEIIAQGSDAISRAVYTFSSVALGRGTPKHVVIALIYYGQDLFPSSVTIGGVTATFISGTKNQGGAQYAAALYSVPSTALESGDVIVTFSAAIGRIYYAILPVYNAVNGIINSAAAQSNTKSANASINTKKGGLMICVAGGKEGSDTGTISTSPSVSGTNTVANYGNLSDMTMSLKIYGNITSADATNTVTATWNLSTRTVMAAVSLN